MSLQFTPHLDATPSQEAYPFPPVDWDEELSPRSSWFAKPGLAEQEDLDWSPRLYQVLDQGMCNNCVAFAAAGVLSDLAFIWRHPSACALSAGFVHQCLGGLACTQSARPRDLIDAMRGKLIPPRKAGDNPYDPSRCDVPGVVAMDRYEALSGPDAAKAKLAKGPILAIMDLYDDFWTWTGQDIYRAPKNQQPRSAHALEVVGFHGLIGDRDGYWIVKNSRGTGWGDKGYARLAYGECRLLTVGGWGFYRFYLAMPR